MIAYTCTHEVIERVFGIGHENNRSNVLGRNAPSSTAAMTCRTPLIDPEWAHNPSITNRARLPIRKEGEGLPLCNHPREGEGLPIVRIESIGVLVRHVQTPQDNSNEHKEKYEPDPNT
eukprot:1717558-Rhodomonas_salina.5